MAVPLREMKHTFQMAPWLSCELCFLCWWTHSTNHHHLSKAAGNKSPGHIHLVSSPPPGCRPMNATATGPARPYPPHSSLTRSFWGCPVFGPGSVPCFQPILSWEAGWSSLQGFKNIILLIGWDWQCFEPVVGVLCPGKSFSHGPAWFYGGRILLSGKTKGNHGAWLGGALFCQIFQATQLCPSSRPVKTFWSDFVRAV